MLTSFENMAPKFQKKLCETQGPRSILKNLLFFSSELSQLKIWALLIEVLTIAFLLWKKKN